MTIYVKGNQNQNIQQQRRQGQNDHRQDRQNHQRDPDPATAQRREEVVQYVHVYALFAMLSGIGRLSGNCGLARIPLLYALSCRM